MGKLKTHCLGPYIIIHITDRGIIQIQKLDGTHFKGLVNGSWLNDYQDSHDLVESELKKSVKKIEKREKRKREEKDKDKNSHIFSCCLCVLFLSKV